MTLRILGLDIGGANLKAAHSDGTARSIPFALWRHPEQLGAAIARLCADMPAYDRLAITMTGELCDCFATRRQGVQAILDCVRGFAGATDVRVWCTTSRFASIDAVVRDPLSAAAANWLALAHWVARQFIDQRVLLLDVGSTTTDIVYLNRGKPEPRALTDQGRLASGELVYTGARRTPICALLGAEVAAELFATTLDAYLVLGMSAEDPLDCNTADGRPATVAAGHARLARMRCTDIEAYNLERARGLAQRVMDIQRGLIQRAIERVVDARPALERIVVSGSGEFLARFAATNHPTTSLTQLLGPDLSESACAYAVAMLAHGDKP